MVGRSDYKGDLHLKNYVAHYRAFPTLWEDAPYLPFIERSLKTSYLSESQKVLRALYLSKMSLKYISKNRIKTFARTTKGDASYFSAILYKLIRSNGLIITFLQMSLFKFCANFMIGSTYKHRLPMIIQD